MGYESKYIIYFRINSFVRCSRNLTIQGGYKIAVLNNRKVKIMVVFRIAIHVEMNKRFVFGFRIRQKNWVYYPVLNMWLIVRLSDFFCLKLFGFPFN